MVGREIEQLLPGHQVHFKDREIDDIGADGMVHRVLVGAEYGRQAGHIRRKRRIAAGALRGAEQGFVPVKTDAVGFDGPLGLIAMEDGPDVPAVDVLVVGDGADDAVRIDPGFMGQLGMREEFAEPGVAGDRGDPQAPQVLVLGKEPADGLFILRGNGQDADAVAEGLLQGIEPGECFDAGFAPGIPEVEDKELAFKPGKAGCPGFVIQDGTDGYVGYGIADFQGGGIFYSIFLGVYPKKRA